MAKIAGRELLSEATVRAVKRIFFAGGIVALVVHYEVDLAELKILGLSLPAELFGVVALVVLIFQVYNLLINWITDMATFKLWYRESDIWLSTDKKQKIDKSFYSSIEPYLIKMYEMDKAEQKYAELSDLGENAQKKFRHFRDNIQPYAVRLERAGNHFRMVSVFGLFFILVQNFLLPLTLAGYAIYLLLSAS